MTTLAPRAASIGCAALMWAASLAGAQTAAPVVGGPNFEQKMGWILRLEDQRVLRDPAPPPAPLALPAKGRPAKPPAVIPPQRPDLVRLLGDGEARVRRRAALAIGRVGLADGVAPLSKVLAADADPEVRQMAAFALGLIGSTAAVDALRVALSERSPLVQGRAAEALGLIGDTASAPAIAAMAAARFAQSQAAKLDPDDLSFPQAPDTEAFRLGIYALTRLKAYEPLASVVLDPAGQPRAHWWPVAYALSRIADPRSAPALNILVRGKGSYTRAYAARGLGIAKDAGAVGPLVLLAQGWQEDARSAVAAIRARGQIGNEQAAPILRSLLQVQNLDTNRRRETVSALGALRDKASLDPIVDLLGDAWPAMRAVAFRVVGDLDPDTFMVVLSGLDPDPHPSVRSTLASLLGTLDPEVARPRLTAMLNDRDVRVLPAAIAALVRMGGSEVGPGLARFLKHDDVMVRAAAAAGIGELKPAGGESSLIALYRSGIADGPYQARAAALAALVRYGAAIAMPVLREALGDPDWAIRVRARALVREIDPTSGGVDLVRPASTREANSYQAPALVSPAVSPHVFIETDKGTIEVEMAMLDAPQTAANFLRLARAGQFSGVSIHRVVPNFVVQDGDARGDGEGGPGYTIRDELNELPFLRGTLGMALDWPDTGGSQFFITHSPQPHLDGRYTVFGRVVAGMEVVDRLQQWDVIRRVRTWDGVDMIVR